MNLIKKIIDKLSAPRVEYEPLIEVRIFKSALLNNLSEFKKQYPKLDFVPVLKSNAYGHGLVEVAKILDDQGAPFFMVDSFFEALVLRRAGIKTKILILGYNRAEQILGNKLKNVSFGIIDFSQLQNLIHKVETPQTFHLKIDTGMHRQGVLIEQVEQAIKLIKSNPNFILEGVCSHFADADGESKEFTQKQISEWNKVVKIFKKGFPAVGRHSEGVHPTEESQIKKEVLHPSDAFRVQDDATSIKYFHTSNTAGAFYTSQADVNVGRLGIGLYGINTSAFQKLNLQSALEMVSIISSIKKIEAGEKVGYGITFESISPMTVATVPVGYTEGMDRRLSSKGFYKIGNSFCPVIGRVSMNMSSIDVTAIKELNLEQEVVVISSNKLDKNSVENIAKICECIPYEVLVKIPSSLKRIVI